MTGRVRRGVEARSNRPGTLLHGWAFEWTLTDLGLDIGLTRTYVRINAYLSEDSMSLVA